MLLSMNCIANEVYIYIKHTHTANGIISFIQLTKCSEQIEQ